MLPLFLDQLFVASSKLCSYHRFKKPVTWKLYCFQFCSLAAHLCSKTCVVSAFHIPVHRVMIYHDGDWALLGSWGYCSHYHKWPTYLLWSRNVGIFPLFSCFYINGKHNNGLVVIQFGLCVCVVTGHFHNTSHPDNFKQTTTGKVNKKTK